RSYFELPPNIFKPLTEATIEGWIKWDRLTIGAGLFDSGRVASGELWAGTAGDAAADLSAGVFARGGTNLTYGIRIPGALRTNEWFHVAFITGPGGMRLFLNGVLVGTNAYTGSFATINNNDQNSVGRWITPNPDDASLTGQIDEFRVWKTQRTAGQIRENMERQLTGNEPDLVGLWNFNDPAQPLRDASPGAHHGKFIGQGTTANVALSAIVYGSIADAAGSPLPNASVDVHQAGGPDRRITANELGEYAFTISSGERCDLFVTTGKLSAYRLGFQLSGESQQRLDWALAETQGGPAVGRDVPIATRRAEDRPPHPSSAAPNRVLRLARTDTPVLIPTRPPGRPGG